MKIIDISQEVFSCNVYPGDPHPTAEKVVSIDNGDVYNIENLIIGGGSGFGTWNGVLGGGLPMPTGITGGGNVNLSIGVGGTSTIDFSQYFDCEDLSVSATSSNSGVVETSVKDAVLTITGKQKTTNAETVEVTVNCGGTATKYTYRVTVNEIGANINIGKEISGDDSKIKNTEHNGADGVIETIDERLTTVEVQKVMISADVSRNKRKKYGLPLAFSQKACYNIQDFARHPSEGGLKNESS
mgnify:CR=1 FL=1